MSRVLTVNTKGLMYLACPYSHSDARVRQARFEAVTRAAACLMSAGHHVFSPITHSHPIVEVCDLPVDWSYWSDFCKLHLQNCYGIAVLRVEGWSESIGIAAEIQIGKDLGLDIAYLDADFGKNMNSNTEIVWIKNGKADTKARRQGT